MDCQRPLLVVRDDGSTGVWACSNHRESKCRPCATRYRRRVQSLAAEGFSSRAGGFHYFLTITAPGDREHYLPSGKRCPCTPSGGVDLARWNPTAAAKWNHLLVLVERQYAVRPRYFRAAEAQKRGALHHHVLMWSPRKLSERVLRRLAVQAGFGHSVQLDPVPGGSGRLAQYVTKTIAGYVTKSADARENVPWWGEFIDYDTGELLTGRTAATYRTWSSSRDWGTSMALIRRAAQEKAKKLRQQKEEQEQMHSATVHSATVTKPSPAEPPPPPPDS